MLCVLEFLNIVVGEQNCSIWNFDPDYKHFAVYSVFAMQFFSQNVNCHCACMFDLKSDFFDIFFSYSSIVFFSNVMHAFESLTS